MRLDLFKQAKILFATYDECEKILRTPITDRVRMSLGFCEATSGCVGLLGMLGFALCLFTTVVIISVSSLMSPSFRFSESLKEIWLKIGVMSGVIGVGGLRSCRCHIHC